jgi:hypothetical protein
MRDAIASSIKEQPMRTTLDIADDVLFAAKEIARREKKSLGQVVSDLVRKAFQTTENSQAGTPTLVVSEKLALYGIEPLPARGVLVTNEEIDRLREAEGI